MVHVRKRSRGRWADVRAGSLIAVPALSCRAPLFAHAGKMRAVAVRFSAMAVAFAGRCFSFLFTFTTFPDCHAAVPLTERRQVRARPFCGMRDEPAARFQCLVIEG